MAALFVSITMWILLNDNLAKVIQFNRLTRANLRNLFKKNQVSPGRPQQIVGDSQMNNQTKNRAVPKTTIPNQKINSSTIPIKNINSNERIYRNFDESHSWPIFHLKPKRSNPSLLEIISMLVALILKQPHSWLHRLSPTLKMKLTLTPWLIMVICISSFISGKILQYVVKPQTARYFLIMENY